jgi:hypothetical protein
MKIGRAEHSNMASQKKPAAANAMTRGRRSPSSMKTTATYNAFARAIASAAGVLNESSL